MPSPETWIDVLERIRETGGLSRSPQLRELYGIAVEDGRRLLGARFRKLPADERDDLVHVALSRIFGMLESAERPRALFITVLTRVAIDYFRRREQKHEVLVGDVPDVVQQEQRNDHAVSPEDHVSAQEEKDAQRKDLEHRLLDLLSPRQREILLDYSEDVPSAETAARLGTTAANVDQIRCRALKRLRSAVCGGVRADGERR
ncbi:MAG: sigma-70 family RNA polymerase sigma factor [Myxococcota bacterium]|nr:sigma-70 family RNA polymerase sigma factor [Myxococcota bacterium]